MSLNVSMTGRPMVAAVNPDTRTWMMRSFGLSAGDVDQVLERVATEILADVMSDPTIVRAAPGTEPPPAPKPIRTMTTTTNGKAETWVNVEAITADLVAQVTTLVADRLIYSLAENALNQPSDPIRNPVVDEKPA